MSVSPLLPTVHTAQSGLVLVFPWRTSAVLAPERRNFVRNAMLGSIHVQEVKDMVEMLAQQVDDAAIMTIHDQFMRGFVRKFLVADNPALSLEDALSSLLQMNKTISLSNSHVLFAAQIFFRYLLLDVCADAYNLPRAESNRLIQNRGSPHWGVEKMRKTVALLQNWPKLIKSFCDMYSARQEASTGQTPIEIPDGNANQRMFIVGLQSLKRAHGHQASKNFDKVMLNIEVLAFAIWWIRMGFHNFPCDQVELMKQLIDQCLHLNLPLEFLNAISNTSDMTSTIAASMRNVLHLALSISPLLLLIPKKLNALGLRRDYLVTHALSLGKDKPQQMQEAEHATWFFAFNLAAGLDKAEQLKKYLERLGTVSSAAIDTGTAHWFDKRLDAALCASGSPSNEPVTAHQSKQASPQLLQMGTQCDSTSLVDIVPASPLNMQVDFPALPTPVNPPTTASNNDPLHGGISHLALGDSRADVESSVVVQDEEVPDQVAQDLPPQHQQLASDVHGVVDTETQPDVDAESDQDSTIQSDRALNAEVWEATVEPIDEQGHESTHEYNHASPRALRPTASKQAFGVYKKDCASQASKSANTNKGKGTSRNERHPILLKAPDLPLPAVSEAPYNFSRTPKSVAPMATVQPEVLSQDVVHVRLHCANQDHPPVDFDFRAPKAAAKIEHRLLSRTQKAVESLFLSGRPPHHTDSAQMVVDTSVSAFFVANKKAFSKLTPKQIQTIFRRRHILIPATSCPEIAFDRRGLSTLGCLTTERQIQVNSENKKLYAGTLLDLLEGDARGKRRVLNVLDIPMGGAPIPPPPGYSHLVSNEQAWQATRDLPAMMTMTFPSDDMQWGTAATSNATSWLHLDDYGLGTVIQNMAGRKYWVVARPKNPGQNRNAYGDLASRFAFPASWDASQPGDKYWDFEGVVLEPGDTLYMRPNTLHYVVTMEDAIVYGRHFLTSSTIQDTSCGIVHCFMMGYCITNTLHKGLTTMLRRMMSMWHMHYDQQSTFSVPPDAHIPDISTVDGLMDLMALGNILELAQVLDPRTYQQVIINWQEQEEMAMARWRYRLLQKIFTKFFVVFTKKHQIHTMSVFRRSLVEFAAALIHYKTDTAQTAPKTPGCTPATVETKVIAYFTCNFPELLPALRQSVDDGVQSFSWSGPELTVNRRTPQDQPGFGRRRPKFNFDDLILYEGMITPPRKRRRPSSSQHAPEDDGEVEIVATSLEPSEETHTSDPNSAREPPPTLEATRSDNADDDIEMDDVDDAIKTVDDTSDYPSSDEQVLEMSHAGPSSTRRKRHRNGQGAHAVKRRRKQ